jgi:hypothetical protein
MKISKDFAEFFELLNKNRVQYLIVGGYAYSVHAEPQYTKNIDIFYENSNENAGRLLKAIEMFGFKSLKLSLDDFTKPGRIIQIGNPPLRIVLLNDIDGVTFEEAWKGKIRTTYGGQIVYVIGKTDLIKNKKAAGRKQDLVDIDNLEKM